MVAEGGRRHGPLPVVLTGGCFQNRLLTTAAARGLEAAGFVVRQRSDEDRRVVVAQHIDGVAHEHRGRAVAVIGR